jgi:Na+/H+-dicarboxylate symporter
VLGTSSEPVLASVLRKLNQLGRQKGVSGLVLLMGYAINLDSSAIYLTLASMFILVATPTVVPDLPVVGVTLLIGIDRPFSVISRRPPIAYRKDWREYLDRGELATRTGRARYTS